MSLKRSRISKVRQSDSGKNLNGAPCFDGAFAILVPLQPRLNQASDRFLGRRYFAAGGAREDFVSVPTSSVRV